MTAPALLSLSAGAVSIFGTHTTHGAQPVLL